MRTAIAAAEDAAQERDIAALRAWIAEPYRDERGRTKRDIEDFLRFWLLRSQKLYVLTRVTEVGIDPETMRARASVFTALASQPIESTGALRDIRADLYWIDLELEPIDGAWRVVAADWRLATLGDLSSDLL